MLREKYLSHYAESEEDLLKLECQSSRYGYVFKECRSVALGWMVEVSVPSPSAFDELPLFLRRRKHKPVWQSLVLRSSTEVLKELNSYYGVEQYLSRVMDVGSL